MTNLTEKWEKGELPSGWYWVEGSRAEGIYAYTAEYLNNMYRPRNSERIVEQVPSYEVYKELIDGRKLLREYIKDITNENAQLKEYERIVASYYMKPIDYETACETVNKLLDEKKVLKEENTKLKELLKECEHMIIAYSINNNTFTKEEIKNIISKIDQVLADNKIQANTVACNKIQENK